MTGPTPPPGPDDVLATIQIDYQAGTQDPGRVFRSMARLIEAFYQLDQDLAKAYSASIEPVVVLERVEAGSIRAVLRTILRQVDDEALRNLEWRPLVGQYLVRAKHRVLRWLDGRASIAERAQIAELQSELASLVPPSIDGQLHLPAPVPQSQLLRDIRDIAESRAQLQQEDRATYSAGSVETPIPAGFGITEEDIDRLLTENTLVSDGELVLLVKRPDYLGSSKWEFRLAEHPIEAKILDEPWLRRFRDGHIVLRPHDALRARVRTELHRGFEANVVSVRYEILEVLGIVRASGGDQLGLMSGVGDHD
jgi:hypothetical protein